VQSTPVEYVCRHLGQSELRSPSKPAAKTGALIQVLRQTVPGMGPDRELSSELEAAYQLLLEFKAQ